LAKKYYETRILYRKDMIIMGISEIRESLLKCKTQDDISEVVNIRLSELDAIL
jgi:hypothetical protein